MPAAGYDPGDLAVVPGPDDGSGLVVYDAGYPAASGRPRVQTQGDVIGTTSWPVTEADVSTSRYIDYSVGGQTGTVNNLGWSNGLWWKRVPFRGQTKQGVMRDLSKDAHGPVGRSNYAGQLAAGVADQFTVPPTLEQVYRSIVGG
jgi:hypothetical protein